MTGKCLLPSSCALALPRPPGFHGSPIQHRLDRILLSCTSKTMWQAVFGLEPSDFDCSRWKSRRLLSHEPKDLFGSLNCLIRLRRLISIVPISHMRKRQLLHQCWVFWRINASYPLSFARFVALHHLSRLHVPQSRSC